MTPTRARWLAAALAFWGVLSVPAWAVKPEAHHLADAKRFKTDPLPSRRRAPSADVLEAVKGFRARFGTGAQVLYHARTGLPEMVTGFKAQARAKDPETSARLFLADHEGVFGVQVKDLKLVLRRGHEGEHLLFSQTHLGLPVEFSRVGVHLDSQGSIHFVQSNFDSGIPGSAVPSVGEFQARAAASADLGAPLTVPGSLVWFPDEGSGRVRLAWKFRQSSGRPRGLWIYYIDAQTGAVLLRYDDLRYVCAPSVSVTSGTVRGEVFPLNPINVDPELRAIPNQQVFVADASTWAVTDALGEYCSAAAGRIFTSLRGPYAVVANDDYPNQAYDNGAGTWFEFATPNASAHPYPANADDVRTITGPVEALRMRVHFTSFDVGINTDDDFDNDNVEIEDAAGLRTVSYIGRGKGAFHSNDVTGRTLRLRLRSDGANQANGYEVDKSSYFVLTVNTPIPMTNPLRASYDLVWSSSTSADRRSLYSYADETNVFYHINKMRDYFVALSPGDPIAVSSPVVATVHAGVNYLNAFYESERGHLYLGDGLQGQCAKQVGLGASFDCSFALDATVIRHEYTHFAMDQVYPVINWGQGGAVSEAVADYFSLSSLNHSKIGEFTNAGEASLRDLNDGIDTTTRCDPARCRKFPGNWTGEIHEDSLPLSQALWSIRRTLPPNAARTDVLVASALYFFPNSFMEFREAMLAVASDVTEDPAINTIFAEHGISTSTYAAGDALEPNDGPQSATDASAAKAIQGTIRPRGDHDFFVFPAGPGRVQVDLSLPPNPGVPGEYIALGLALHGPRNEPLADNDPEPSNGTGGGGCPDPDTGGGSCLTGQSTVTLTFDNPSSRVLYAAVACGLTDFGSPALCDSDQPYTVRFTFDPAGSVSGAVLTASFDNDVFRFSVPLVAFEGGRIYDYSHAQLRDHALKPMPETDSRNGALALVELSTTVVAGVLSGQLRIRAGLAQRYPAVGSVHLEVFGRNRAGRVVSLGVSPPLGLTAKTADFKAWNNVMNPLKGDRATLKFALTGTGQVTLKIYTLTGQKVRTLVNQVLTGGGSADWDGRNDEGAVVASGVYLAHVEGPGVSKTQKIVLVK